MRNLPKNHLFSKNVIKEWTTGGKVTLEGLEGGIQAAGRRLCYNIYLKKRKEIPFAPWGKLKS